MLVITAHGALGNWDEIIFIAVIIIFVGMMVSSWFKSRQEANTPAEKVEPTTTPTQSDESPHHTDDHFELK